MNSFFTLIELLVVFAIFSILISLISPAYKKIIGTSQLIQCSSNLKSVFSIVTIYSEDYDQSYPGPTKGTVIAKHSNTFGLRNDGFPERNSSYLSSYLSFYVNSTKLDYSTSYIPFLICPANDNDMQYDIYSRLMYYLPNTNGLYPFGKMGRNGAPNARSLKTFSIDSPDKYLGIQEVFDSKKIYPATADEPVHFGIYLNNMYLDGRVEDVLAIE